MFDLPSTKGWQKTMDRAMDQQQEVKHGAGSSSSGNGHLDDIRSSVGNESKKTFDKQTKHL